MRDPIVHRNLLKRGYENVNSEDLNMYDLIQLKPRHLDKAPKRFSLNHSKDLEIYGCYAQYVMSYNKMTETPVEQGRIVLNGATKFCDVPVYYTLRTLAYQGFSKIADISSSCFNLFKEIAMLDCDTITVSRVYDLLKSYTTDNYYEKELIRGIKATLFADKAIGYYWVNKCCFEGLYTDCLRIGQEYVEKNFNSEKEVDAFIKEHAQAAKADKEFMKNIVKGTNRYVYAMMYALRDTYPDITRMYPKKNGFM